MHPQPSRRHVRSDLDTVQAAPGTEILYDQGDENTKSHTRFEQYQHLRRGDGHILLVPQPSLTDPNDPLRWSALKKWATFCNGLAYAFLGAVTGPIMAAWMIQGSKFFQTSLQRMSYANGATLVCQGVATTLWMPFAVKFGRRPVYLLSTLLMGCACLWLGIASRKTFSSFLLGRAFLGIWEAPIESIVPSTITDIFFLHDRGAMVSIYGLSVLGGNELGPMLSAFIIQYLGMDWAFYIVAIFIGLNLAFYRGMALSWNVVLGATTAQLFAPPPYLFSPSAQGLVFLSPLIGSLVGTYLCGPLADRVANSLTRRNNGIREPEMRLSVCAIAMLLTFIGAAITGVTLHHQTSWPGPVVGFGILSTGAQMGATLAMSYALDCHRELSIELMVTVASLKSLIAWIWTWVINDWVAKNGPLVVFLAIASVNAAVYLTTLIFYLKGKSIRIWVSQQHFCRAFGL